jgi:ParB family chromosome partitioning protein
MAARKSGLGKGLGALIPVDATGEGLRTIPLSDIVPNPHQPREIFDEEALASLAASIAEIGVLQPVIVQPAGTDVSADYVLIAGERRWRSAQMAGLTDIPAIVRGEVDAEHSLSEAVIENVQRQDLTALEEAAAYQQLLEDFGMTHEAVARRVGKSRTAVTNTIRLLQLPAPIQAMINRGDLTAGHGRALLAVEDTGRATNLAERAVSEEWSVRQVEEAVKVLATRGEPAAREVAEKAMRPAAIIELEERLADHLGTKVKIDYGKRGGKVTVRFSSLDDLERIYRSFFG